MGYQFDLMEFMELLDSKSSITDDTPEKELLSYLKKGEKILSLARKIVPRQKKDSCFLSHFKREYLSLSDSEKWAAAYSAAEKTFKKTLKLAMSGSEKDKQLLLSFFNKTGYCNAVLEPLTDSQNHALSLWDKKSKGGMFLGKHPGIRLLTKGGKRVEKKDDYEVILSLVSSQRRWEAFGLTNSSVLYKVVDAKKLKYSFLCFIINQLLQEHFSSLSEDEKKEDEVYQSLTNAILKELSSVSVGSSIYIRDYQLSQSTKYAMARFIEDLGYQVVWVEQEQLDNDFPIFRKRDMILPMLNLDSIQAGISPSGFLLAANLLIENYLSEIDNESYRKEIESIATVFDDKKNIPLKTLKMMKESGFNDFFGYIELDELCILKDVEELEREFRAMKKLCFGNEKYEQVSLRFRLLGRHKAIGLFNPMLNCICVDIRYPHSFGHEYLHMYDFNHGELSAKYSFSKVKNLYRQKIREKMDKLAPNSELRVRLEGKSKYNLSYFDEATEIFARCGEIYFTQIRGVDNSLLRPEGGFGYPDDQELLAEIRSYYNTLFDQNTALMVLPEKRYYPTGVHVASI